MTNTKTNNGIYKKTFMAYEAVRLSGVTNMWNVGLVSELSGLEKDIVFHIMRNYNELHKEFIGD